MSDSIEIVSDDLIYLVQEENITKIKRLIDECTESFDDINIDGQEYSTGYTALMYAADLGNIEIMELLIEAGANIELEDWEGWTALTHATENEHWDAVELLKAKQK